MDESIFVGGLIAFDTKYHPGVRGKTLLYIRQRTLNRRLSSDSVVCGSQACSVPQTHILRQSQSYCGLVTQAGWFISTESRGDGYTDRVVAALVDVRHMQEECWLYDQCWLSLFVHSEMLNLSHLSHPAARTAPRSLTSTTTTQTTTIHSKRPQKISHLVVRYQT